MAKKVKKNFLGWNPEPTMYKVISWMTASPYQVLSRRVKLLSLKFPPIKFCQQTLFESGGAVFIKNSRIYNFEENKQGFDGKSRTLTHFAALEEQYSGQSIKCLAKWSRLSLADSVVQFAVPCICMRESVAIHNQ